VQIFRFVDPVTTTTVRLNLVDPTGWQLGRGFDLGARRLERVWLTQPPYDGGTLASSFAPPVKMVVPLVLMPQVDAATVRAKYNLLKTELDRPVNAIEMREPNDSTSFIIDTFRADVPSLAHHAFDAPNMFLSFRSIGPFILEIDRMPDLRGAGLMI
jgi:hypothetical protein